MVSLSRDLSEIGEQVIVLPFLQDHKHITCLISGLFQDDPAVLDSTKTTHQVSSDTLRRVNTAIQ